jgi:hypothetical protein
MRKEGWLLALNWYRAAASSPPAPAIREMKARKSSPPNIMWKETIQAMGGAPTPLEWAEVYTGLAQKVVDAAEAPLSTLLGSRLYEVAKVITLTAHFKAITGMVIGEKFFQGLPPNVQKILEEEALRAAADERRPQEARRVCEGPQGEGRDIRPGGRRRLREGHAGCVHEVPRLDAWHLREGEGSLGVLTMRESELRRSDEPAAARGYQPNRRVPGVGSRLRVMLGQAVASSLESGSSSPRLLPLRAQQSSLLAEGPRPSHLASSWARPGSAQPPGRTWSMLLDASLRAQVWWQRRVTFGGDPADWPHGQPVDPRLP